MCSTSAPCAARVRPQTGPAITRVRSSTLSPSKGRDASGGNGVGGASPMRSMRSGGSSAAVAAPCPCASHSAKLRMAVTQRPAAAAASSKSRPAQPPSAARTAARVPSQRRRRSTPARWCGKLVCSRTTLPSPQRIGAGDGVPRVRRLRAVQPQVVLAVELQRRVPHVDPRRLLRTAAPPMNGRRRCRHRRHRGLRRGADAEGGGQRRLLAGQRNRAERRRRETRQAPERLQHLARVGGRRRAADRGDAASLPGHRRCRFRPRRGRRSAPPGPVPAPPGRSPGWRWARAAWRRAAPRSAGSWRRPAAP